MKNLTFLTLIFTLSFYYFSCEKYDPTLGEPPSDTDAQFSYVPTSANPNIIDFTANNLRYTSHLGLWQWVQGREQTLPAYSLIFELTR